MFKMDLEKAEESGIKLPTSTGKSKRIPEKHLLLLHCLHYSSWLCWSQQTVDNSSRDGNIRSLYLLPEKSVCRSRSNSENWTWNNRLLPNWERSMSRLYIVTLLGVHHVICQAGWSSNWNQDCRDKYQQPDMQMTPPLWQKAKRN